MPYLYTCSDPNYTIYVGIDSSENDLLAKYGWPNDILFHVSNLSSGHIYLRTPFDSIDLKLFKKVKKNTDFFKIFKIPLNVIEECLHLTKASSIKGKTLDSVNIDITPWINVEKVKGTNAGTIHFKDMKYVTVLNIKYDNSKDQSKQNQPKNKHSKQSKNKQKKKKKKFTEKKEETFYDDDSNKEKQSSNIYNKKKWKKKLKALEKTKETMDVKNVERYLTEQQSQRNEMLKLKQKRGKKKMKEQMKKEKLEKQKAQDLENYTGVFDGYDMTSNQNMTEDFEDNFM